MKLKRRRSKESRRASKEKAKKEVEARDSGAARAGRGGTGDATLVGSPASRGTSQRAERKTTTKHPGQSQHHQRKCTHPRSLQMHSARKNVHSITPHI